jgi:hypothetical protein
MLVFQAAKPCGFVGRYKRFVGTYSVFRAEVKLDTVSASDTLVSKYKFTQYCNPEELHGQSYEDT